ncbi:MAG: hypothetical protein KJP23_12300 [Deltaproteobacteria bacterium]|nr:hypothetical protein [Deltaproteobacteria bacterium]
MRQLCHSASASNILIRLIDCPRNGTTTKPPTSHKEKYERLTCGQITRTKLSEMNNLYVIRKDDPFQLVDDFGLIDEGYELTGIDDSLPQDLDVLDQKERVEHRYHKRFQLKEDAFALIRSISTGPLNIQGKSMGCIACSVFNAKPARLGKIDNVSMGGLMFQHVAGKTQLNNAFVLDILLADCRFYLANMPFKIKADVVLPDDIPGSSFATRQVRLQFQNLSANQQARLKDFIKKHGTGLGAPGVKD